MLQDIWYWGEVWAFLISGITSDKYGMLKIIDHRSLDRDRYVEYRDDSTYNASLIREEQSGVAVEGRRRCKQDHFFDNMFFPV